MSDPSRERRPKAGELPAETIPPEGRQSDMRLQPDSDLSNYRAAGKLRGKVALVTGGDSGIGRAVAVAFALEGADVAIVYLRNDGDAEETRLMVESGGRRCLTIRADAGAKAECERAVERTVERTVAELGRLDVLVNNAAHQSAMASIEELTEEELRRTFDTNILGFFFMAQAALKHLGPGSAIINTSSTTSLMGHPQIVHYASTKGAVNVFTKSLALHLADRGVRVNAVLPGPVWTPIIPAGAMDPKDVANFGSQAALKRPGQPEELAPAYVYLAARDSSFATGTLLEVSGGYVSVG